MQTNRLKLRAVLSVVVVMTMALLQSCAGTSTQAARRSEAQWIGVWGSSAAANAPNGQPFNNQTLRLIAHSSFGGDEVRIRIANTYGTKSLAIGAAGVALQSADAGIQSGSHRAVTFGGRTSTSIPPGALIVSDPVSLKVAAQTNLSVSIFLPNDTGPATAHPGANQISYASGAGNFVATVETAPFATQLQSWPLLAGIEVRAGAHEHTIVTFGDSITDGYKSTVSANKRWPDFFTARMHAAGKKVAVVNAGISGNRLLHDSAGGSPRFGPNALSRFDRDALTVSGATHVVTLIGINDIGMGSPARSPEEVVSADEIIAAHEQLIMRAHARGLKIVGATLTPFRGAAYFTEEGEKKRETVNAWIRANKNYDGVIDFDKATLDPQKPSQMLAAYDSGDHLHPNDAGYKAMADAVDLRLFD
jgi:lysophospholipase L1-like esterase